MESTRSLHPTAHSTLPYTSEVSVRMSEGTGAQKSAQNTTQARSGITGDQIHESQAHTSHATKDSEEFEPGIHLEPSEGTFG